MSPAVFALLARLHGHAAILGLAALAHPVVTLRPEGGRGGRTAGIAVALHLAATFAGLALYGDWRRAVKPGILADPSVWWFESKEHLAIASAALAFAGAALLVADGGRPAARRLARVLLGLALAAGVACAALGVAVASRAHPSW